MAEPEALSILELRGSMFGGHPTVPKPAGKLERTVGQSRREGGLRRAFVVVAQENSECRLRQDV
jgi:hypothetical protein